MDATGITETILDIAEQFEQKAKRLREYADEIDKTGDLTIAGEAISCCIHFGNMRVDLLAARPIRHLQRQLERAKPGA